MKLSWKWIAIGVGSLLLIYGVSYGYRTYQYYKEKAAIVDKQKEIQEELEKADLEHTKKEEELYRKLAEKESQIKQKDVEIGKLEDQIHNIVVPSDPNALVDAFKRRGFGSATILNRP